MRKYYNDFNEDYERGYAQGRKDALNTLDEGLEKDDSSVRVAEIAKKKGIKVVPMDTANVEVPLKSLVATFTTTELDGSDDLGILDGEISFRADFDEKFDTVAEMFDKFKDIKDDMKKLETFVNLFEY